MNNRNPTPTIPMTLSTRDTISCGKLRLKMLTANIHSPSISVHNSSEPSWPPHTPATR